MQYLENYGKTSQIKAKKKRLPSKVLSGMPARVAVKTNLASLEQRLLGEEATSPDSTPTIAPKRLDATHGIN